MEIHSLIYELPLFHKNLNESSSSFIILELTQDNLDLQK